jgi:hypothetical protein
MRVASVHMLYKEGSFTVAARGIKERAALAAQIVQDTGGNADIVVFPAGLFVCGEENACSRAAAVLPSVLPKRSCTVVFGVDCRRSDNINKSTDSAYRHFYLYCVDHAGGRLVWGSRQRGNGSHLRVSTKGFQEERVVVVAGKTVGLLICGEITTRASDVPYRPQLGEYLVSQCGAEVILDAAHCDRQIVPHNRSWFPAMRNTGRPAVLSQHLYESYLTNGLYCAAGNKGPDYSANAGRPTVLTGDGYVVMLYTIG